MERVNTCDDHDPTEADIAQLYEEVRAAERQNREPPFASASMQVEMDWDTLEERAFRRSLPERVRSGVIGMSDAAVAGSGIIPLVVIPALLLWLRSASADISGSNIVLVLAVFVMVAFMLLWLSLATKVLLDSEASRKRTFAQVASLCAISAILLTVVLTSRRTASDDDGYGPVIATATTPRDLTDRAAIELARNNFEGAVKTAETVAEQTTPQADPDIWLQNADQIYQKVMRVNPHDPQVSGEIDRLTAEAIQYLEPAAQVHPNNASVWTRLAEMYVLRGDLNKAGAAIRRVEAIPSVGTVERGRARLLASYISARNISTELKTVTEEKKPLLASQIDSAIVQASSVADETGADASALLTHLHLARASVSTDEKEIEEHEEKAQRASRVVLAAPDVALRTLDPPTALLSTTFDAPNVQRPPAGQTPGTPVLDTGANGTY